MSEVPEITGDDRDGASEASPGTSGEAANGGAEKLRLGGMALRNGLLVHAPSSWAAAVRAGDGSVRSASGPKPRLARGRLGEIPIVRGPIRLAEAMIVIPLVRLKLRAARLPLEDPGVVVASAASSALSSGARRLFQPGLRRELAVSLAGLVPAAVALRDRDLAAYHGAEHKAIGAYERGLKSAAPVPKEHERCGSALIGPMILTTTVAALVLRALSPAPSRTAQLAASALAAGTAVEIFAQSEKRPDSPLGRAVRTTGHTIQARFSTREPTADQLEVAEAAVQLVLKEEAKAADSNG